MKPIRICLCLALALLLACAPAAMANQLPVPAPTEAPAAQSGGGLPVPDIPQPKIELLPHPGTFLGEEGELALTGYEFDGAVWDVWYIPMGNDWGNQLTEWLKACREAGYTWKPGTTEGNTSYEVTDGEKRALLLPDYYGRIMFMKQDGLEMAEFAYVAPEVPELQLDQVHIIYNGVDYGFFDRQEEGWFCWDNEYNIYVGFQLTGVPIIREFISMILPPEIATGDSFHVTKESKEKNALAYGHGSSTYLEHGKLLSASDTDYCDFTVIYRDEETLRVTVEGSFKKGTEQVFLEFYLSFD